jgi:hypothetical protein
LSQTQHLILKEAFFSFLEGRGFNPAVPALLLEGLQPLSQFLLAAQGAYKKWNVAASRDLAVPGMSREILSIFRIT